MLPDLEQMILDLEGRGWYMDECYWAPDVKKKYEVKMKHYDWEGDSTGLKHWFEKLTFLGAITEAWRVCK